MNASYVYTCIAVMAAVTYLIRVIPLLALRKPIKNRFIRSFLYYAPYVTLSVLTFPAILYATGSIYSSAIGFGVALVCAFFRLGLPLTATAGCLSALLAGFIF